MKVIVKRQLNNGDFEKIRFDIVTQSQLKEMTEKFLNLSIQERDNLIKNM